VTEAHRAERALSGQAFEGEHADDLAARPVEADQHTVRWMLTQLV
jgi:hypothetical protein